MPIVMIVIVTVNADLTVSAAVVACRTIAQWVKSNHCGPLRGPLILLFGFQPQCEHCQLNCKRFAVRYLNVFAPLSSLPELATSNLHKIGATVASDWQVTDPTVWTC